MTRIIWILVFILYLGTAFAHAQGSGRVEGKITDQMGQPFPGVAVQVAGSALSQARRTTTDREGRYGFGNLPEGVYEVTVVSVGYQMEVRRDIRVVDGAVVVVQVSLRVAETNLQDRVVVSASRKEEKILDAPASVVVVDAGEIEGQRNLTIAEHVKHLSSVDFVQTGLTQTNVVVRGFNNVSSGALLSFIDNRISRLPSLRFNTHNFIPLVTDDIERIELVLGPASALYGPNSASGVMHVITRSPFDSEGTTIHSGGGERNLRTLSFRHASVLSDKIAFKVSGGHYFAKDWVYEDPEEVAVWGKNPRDYNIERTSGEVRLDLRPSEKASLTFSAGYTKASNLEMTTLGAAQVRDWTYNFIQGRLRHGNWFGQMYYNRSNAGTTERLRSRSPVVDRSTLAVFQLQHAASLGGLKLTYGIDALSSIPKTGGTISGIYEDQDAIEVVGLYLQSEMKLSDRADLVLAGRYDSHNHILKPVFSPRAALVLKPSPEQTVRFTFNRAFGTPTSTNLFLDILFVPDPFKTGIDLRAQGTFQGFTFQHDADQSPMFRSPFAPLAGRSVDDYIAMNDPQFNNVLWQVGRNQTLDAFRQSVSTEEDADALVAQLQAVVPQTLSGLTNELRVFSVGDQTFVSVLSDSLADIPKLKSNITQAYEVGYKAVIGNKLVVTADLYRNQKEDFVGQFEAETPNVFLSSTALKASLDAHFQSVLRDSTRVGLVQRLDAPVLGGNGNGTPIDELTRMFVGTVENPGLGAIPFGTVSPVQATDPTAVILTYRNFGNITIYGLDLNFIYYANDAWTIGFNYSHLSENLFPTRAVNAPQDKFNLGSRYRHAKTGLSASGWIRHRGSFPMESGAYAGLVDGFTVCDLDLVYELPIHSPDASVTANLQVSNLFDRKHREFVGAPEIGRLISGGLTVRF